MTPNELCRDIHPPPRSAYRDCGTCGPLGAGAAGAGALGGVAAAGGGPTDGELPPPPS